MNDQRTGRSDTLVRFYRGETVHPRGWTPQEIIAWPDDLLEHHHDYIQWLFPLLTRSRFNSDAPALDDAQIEIFRADPQLHARVEDALRRMLHFYGLVDQTSGGQLTIIPAPNWAQRKAAWLTPHNHNYLRLTRILTSLRLLGLEPAAQALFRALSVIYQDERERIGAETFGFWSRAATGPLERRAKHG